MDENDRQRRLGRMKTQCKLDQLRRRYRSRDEWPKFFIRKKRDEVPALSLRIRPSEGEAEER